MIRRVLQIAEYSFTILGLLAMGYCVTTYVRARMFQHIESGEFTHALQQQISRVNRSADDEASRRAEEPPPRDGAVIAKLAIPRLGLSTMVVEGDDIEDLKVAPGHIPGTALPGEHGNVGIAAHRDTFFRPLRLIRKGDTIGITTLHGTYRYRVVSTTVVSPDDTRLLNSTGHDTLTLVTCYPFYYVGPAPKRFILRAEPSA
jgi:sortase A